MVAERTASRYQNDKLMQYQIVGMKEPYKTLVLHRYLVCA
jgi:hypothetical protein